MELENIMIPAVYRFASLYIEQKQPVKDFFHYDWKKESVFADRYEDLQQRSFQRDKLAACIKRYMSRFPQAQETEASLARLQNESSAVVIGGQQAGLLTGPLYTIHKIISIIHLAKQETAKLGKPVVPIFWIAGEDHDFLEINHVFVEKNRKIEKIGYSDKSVGKKMASDIIFDKKQLTKWVKNIFETFGETSYTKDVLASVEQAIAHTSTIVDFFAYLVMDMFKHEGLLIIDSAFEPLRELEKPFFKQLIENHSEITAAVLEQQEMIVQNHFSKAIEMEEDAANLFYYEKNERVLLSFDPQDQCFVGKNGDLRMTKQELLHQLEQNSTLFSNNVTTRPLMQEWLFPTLAFIAGPGEIAYWAELKKAFELFEGMMPPIVPRLNMTLLTSALDSDMKELKLPLERVLQEGTKAERHAYWDTIMDEDLNSLLEETKHVLSMQYKQIQQKIKELDKGMLPLVEKNKEFHLQQINFLQRKTLERLELKHDVILEKYARVERFLYPHDSPQERIWNVFYYLNHYGPNLIQNLTDLPHRFDGTHQIIKI